MAQRGPQRRDPGRSGRAFQLSPAHAGARPARRDGACLGQRRQRRRRRHHGDSEMSGPTSESEVSDGAAKDLAGLPPAPEVFQIEVGLLQNFCEIIYCPTTRAAAVVDPAWEADRLLREAKALGVKITTVLITHTHNDHIEGVAELCALTGAAVAVSPREADNLRRI